jgi:hypothetical protein
MSPVDRLLAPGAALARRLQEAADPALGALARRLHEASPHASGEDPRDLPWHAQPVWLACTVLDVLPAYRDGRWHRPGGWGCRLGLRYLWSRYQTVTVPPDWREVRPGMASERVTEERLAGDRRAHRDAVRRREQIEDSLAEDWAGPAEEEPAEAVTAPDRGDLPLRDYDHLPVAALGHRIRSLNTGNLRQLLAYEREHADRPAVIRLLQARMAELDAGAQPSPGGSQEGPEWPPPPSAGSPVNPAAGAPPASPPPHGNPAQPARPKGNRQSP